MPQQLVPITDSREKLLSVMEKASLNQPVFLRGGLAGVDEVVYGKLSQTRKILISVISSNDPGSSQGEYTA
jgi:hypothetical protein